MPDLTNSSLLSTFTTIITPILFLFIQLPIKTLGLDPETTLFIIVSKSFKTIETIENAKKSKEWFVAESKGQNIKDHFIGISNNTSAAKKFGINGDSVFPIPEWVGGRFSLWGSAGLIIAISIGSENYIELLNGANSMDRHFRESSFENNIPVLLALISIWYNNFFNPTP